MKSLYEQAFELTERICIKLTSGIELTVDEALSSTDTDDRAIDWIKDNLAFYTKSGNYQRATEGDFQRVRNHLISLTGRGRDQGN